MARSTSGTDSALPAAQTSPPKATAKAAVATSPVRSVRRIRWTLSGGGDREDDSGHHVVRQGGERRRATRAPVAATPHGGAVGTGEALGDGEAGART